MKVHGLGVFLSFALLILASTANAAELQPQGPQGPCAEDIKKLCGSVAAGQGRIAKCLKNHEAETSAGCKAEMGKIFARIDGIKKACSPDLEKFCKKGKPGEPKGAQCLQMHAAELSSVCKQSLKPK